MCIDPSLPICPSRVPRTWRVVDHREHHALIGSCFVTDKLIRLLLLIPDSLPRFMDGSLPISHHACSGLYTHRQSIDDYLQGPCPRQSGVRQSALSLSIGVVRHLRTLQSLVRLAKIVVEAAMRYSRLRSRPGLLMLP